jgi:hypothetical protein
MVKGEEKGLLAYSVDPGAILTELAEAMPAEALSGKWLVDDLCPLAVSL